MVYFCSLAVIHWCIFVEFELGFSKINLKQKYVLRNYVIESSFSVYFCAQLYSTGSLLSCYKNEVSVLIKV